MKIKSLSLLFCFFTNCCISFGQDSFIPLKHESKTVTFFLEGVGMTNDGSILTAIREGDNISDEMSLDSLSLFSIDFITAGLYLKLSKKDTSELGQENSYFVSVGFFNKDKEFVFGHNFCSDYGFSLAGVRSDLPNVSEMTLIDNGNGYYTLQSFEEIAIHQIYLYEGEIKFVVVKITHLGAG